MSQTGRRYAILIGSSQFNNEPLRSQPLQCPERDVDGLHALLAAEEFGAFGETFVFKNADNHAVLDRIEEVLTNATRDDQVLIYYSGHGKTDLPGRLYLTTPNTEVRKLFSTSIPVETLRQVIDLSACRRIILILDCCYGGAAGKSWTKGSVDEKLVELGRGNGIYILTASTAAQTAQEREGDDYGLMTKHIITGIKDGAAASDDGLITMDGLYRYVYSQVTGEGYQEPMRWALNVKGEDLIIARSSKTPSRERQRLLTEKIIEVRESLPRSIFNKAFQVIDERRAPFYELVDELYRQRLQIGEFVDEWHRLESAERQQSPLPPKRTEITAAPTEPAKPPAIAEPPPSLPVNKPSSESAQSTGFSRKPSATRQPPEGGTQSSFTPKVLLFWATLLTSRRARAWLIGSVIGLPVSVLLIYLITLIPTRRTSLIIPSTMPTPVSSPTNTLNQNSDFAENLNGIKLEMVRVAGDTFKMGSPEGKGDNDEHPQHDVTVPGFYIGKFEVTQAQWKVVKGGNNPSNFKGDDNLPVEDISWNDAKEFCQKLSQMTGKNYRLPSEAEWEYACRAGTIDDYAGTLDEMAWYSSNSGSKTHPVGKKTPNAFGLFDMHGNVWEWCEDVWHGDYKKAPTDGSAWLTGGDSTYRVLRGGSWVGDGSLCRSAERNRDQPGSRDLTFGFRVVVSL